MFGDRDNLGESEDASEQEEEYRCPYRNRLDMTNKTTRDKASAKDTRGPRRLEGKG